MENTYTFIARSAQDPGKVATFTLHDHHMSVGLGVPLEQVERALASAGEQGESEPVGESAGGETPWLKPAAVSLAARRFRPFNVADVQAELRGQGLSVRAWTRARGLRLVPVSFAWEEVDNPEAAGAFVDELDQRKAEAGYPGRLRGPLDYWAGWLALGAAVLALLLPVLRRDEET